MKLFNSFLKYKKVAKCNKKKEHATHQNLYFIERYVCHDNAALDNNNNKHVDKICMRHRY